MKLYSFSCYLIQICLTISIITIINLSSLSYFFNCKYTPLLESVFMLNSLLLNKTTVYLQVIECTSLHYQDDGGKIRVFEPPVVLRWLQANHPAFLNLAEPLKQ